MLCLILRFISLLNHLIDGLEFSLLRKQNQCGLFYIFMFGFQVYVSVLMCEMYVNYVLENVILRVRFGFSN